MNTGWTWESGALNVAEEWREPLLCINRAAQWPVTAMQLTAALCCREHQISALHANNPHAHLERHFSAGPRQFAAQLDGLGRMALNLQPSAFNTKSINHLWQPQCAHTDGSWRRVFSFSKSSSDWMKLIVSSSRSLWQTYNVANKASSAPEIKKVKKLVSAILLNVRPTQYKSTS